MENRAGHEAGGPEPGTTDKLWDLRDGLGSQSPLLKGRKWMRSSQISTPLK